MQCKIEEDINATNNVVENLERMINWLLLNHKKKELKIMWSCISEKALTCLKKCEWDEEECSVI